LKNVLIDQNCKYLIQDEYAGFLKEYNERFLVGRDIKQTSFDENCAYFCLDEGWAQFQANFTTVTSEINRKS